MVRLTATNGTARGTAYGYSLWEFQVFGTSSGGGGVPRAVRAIKKKLGDAVFIATDVCLCAYTDHGHCGVIEGERDTGECSGREDTSAGRKAVVIFHLGLLCCGSAIRADSDHRYERPLPEGADGGGDVADT